MPILEGLAFEGLTTAARQLLVRRAIPGLLAEGFSATGALNYLKQFGPVMRKQDFLGVWREFSQIPKMASAWRFIRKDYRVQDQFTVKTQENLKQQYRYLFKVYGKDLTTGESTWRWVSTLSNEKISPEAAQYDLTFALRGQKAQYDLLYDFEIDPSELEFFVVFERESTPSGFEEFE